MEHLSGKAAEQLHAEINEADAPDCHNLEIVCAKHLAYYTGNGKKKISPCDTDDKPSTSTSKRVVLHSIVNTKEEKNQTPTLSGPEQPSDATNGQKLLIPRSSEINHQRKERETLIINPETPGKYMIQTCILELDHRLLENQTIPEIQKLQHVMSWAQLFLSKSQEAAHMQKFSQLSQGLILSQSNEGEIELSSGKKEARSSHNSLSQLTDDFNLNEHTNIFESSSLSSASEVSLAHRDRCISLNLLRDSTLFSENKCFCNIQPNNGQRTRIIRNKREKEDLEMTTCILGQFALADQTCNSKENTIFQNIGESDLELEVHSVNSQPQIVCKTDNCSSKINGAPHEDPSTYFWAPLVDSSDEECTDRTVKIKRPDWSGAEIKEHKKSLHSSFTFKGKNIKYLSSAVLGGNIASGRKTFSNGKWTVEEEHISENKEIYKHKDFKLALKSHGCSEGKFTADNIEGEAENKCIPHSESEAKNSELEDLVVDLIPLKRETDQGNESRFKDVEDTDSTVEVKKWIKEEQIDNIFNSICFDKSLDKEGNYKTAQRETEVKRSEKDPAMQSGNPLLNCLEHAFKVCPDCKSLSYPEVTWCKGCGCILLGVLTQSGEDNMEHKSKVILRNVTDKQKKVSSEVFKFSQVPESSSEEFLKRSDSCHKLCWDDKLLHSGHISVLDKYYFYLNQLNNARCLDPKGRKQPFSSRECSEVSKEKNITQHIEGKVVDPEETEETNSDCGATELSFVNDINADAVKQENSHLGEQDTSEGESTSRYVFLKQVDNLELNGKTKQKRSHVSVDRKLSETKRIMTKVTASKRYWEKSSIAWSSYTHGELKPRSQCRQRPVSADVSKKMINISQNIQLSGSVNSRQVETHPLPKPTTSAKAHLQPTDYQAASVVSAKTANVGTNSKHPWKSTFQGFEETLNWESKGENDLAMWLLLPDELWLHIFSLFSHKELSHIAQVCHRFYRLVSDESFWRRIQIADCRCLNDEWLIHLGLRHPQSFTLYRCYDETQSVTQKGLQKFFQHCRESLTELNITSCSGPGLRGDTILLQASTFCNRLTSVDISWTGATDLGIIALAEASLSLRGLSANGCQLTDKAIRAVFKKRGKSLIKLEIFGCHALTANCLSSMATECPNLQTLNIGRVPKITDVCLSKIVNCLKKLTTLNMTGLNVVRDHVVHFIVTQCPKLECLVLSSCSQVTDISLMEISTYLPTIRYLDVSGCKKVTDIGIQALVGTCRQLYYLDLSSTGTSKKGVYLLASFCHISLECVKLSFCKDVSLDAVKNLCKYCKRLKVLHLYGCHFSYDLESIKEISKTVQVYHDFS